MRTHKTLVILLCLGLLGATGTVLAAHNDDHKAPDRSADAQERREAQKARVAELREARAAALAMFHENRTAAIEKYRADNDAVRENFLAEKKLVIEACRADKAADRPARDNATAANDTASSNETAASNTTAAERNATRDQRREANADHAKCVKDGLKPLIEEARAGHKQAREDFQAAMREARGHAMKHFMNERAKAHARHGAPQE